MITLALLASSAAMNCEDFASHRHESLAVTVTPITAAALGARPVTQPGSPEPAFLVGVLTYINGVTVRSSDPRFAGIAVAKAGFMHSCGYRFDVPWNAGNYMQFRPQPESYAPQSASMPELKGYKGVFGIPMPVYSNLGLMHPVSGAKETLVVSYSGEPGSEAGILARLPMKLDGIVTFLNAHGPSFLGFVGREPDGALTQLIFNPVMPGPPPMAPGQAAK